MQDWVSFNTLLWFQACFYAFTGLWPLLHYRSFEKITGPKTDKWLVITVGYLISASAFVFSLAALKPQPPKEVCYFALLDSVLLFGIDTYYVSKKVISRVYLYDAVAEAALFLAWGYVFSQHQTT